MDAVMMEPRARAIVGLEHGDRRPLSYEEREWMARDAYQLDPAYPYEDGIALSDYELANWWLYAMRDYVRDMFDR